MDNKITIGIPRSLLYYKYNILWLKFFKELGIETIISPESDYEIFENGKKNTVNEACFPLKIYIGHVYYLKDKCDYVLVPRIASLENDTNICTVFNALYDLVRNTFEVNILNYNIDAKKGLTEEIAFVKMGQELGFGKEVILSAYKLAKKEEYKQNKINYLLQEKRLYNEKTKILLIGYLYNIFDNLTKKMIMDVFIEYDIDIIYANIKNPDKDKKTLKNLTYNQQILNSIEKYKDKVNGIVIVSTFPCVSNTLINKMFLRKINKKTISILINELNDEEDIREKILNFIDDIKKGDTYE